MFFSKKWVTSEVLPAIRKTGQYSVHAVYPGSMTPTSCVVLTCYTADGQAKQAYLLYGDDDWFRYPKWHGDREIIMRSMLCNIADDDREVVRYDRDAFYLKDGKWDASALLRQSVDKRTESGNAITDCQKAIERYRKAKDKVKVSAEAMLEFLNDRKI